MKAHSIRALLLVLAMLSLAWPSAAAVAPETPELPTPALIERAVARGELDRRTADRYLVAAIRGEQVPERFESATPFDGTLVLLALNDRRNREHPTPLGADRCDISIAPMPNTIESAHFYIEYDAALIAGGLTIADYVAALEAAWTKEVDQYGWAAPPAYPPSPAPSNKYPVRVDVLGPAVYGFVSNFGTHAGRVGDNPATRWNEGDADASCMVLNTNFDPFPGTPLVALQATAAHEFNHSTQFGWGVLSGTVPDPIFIEGGAAWMEDEVFDDANDSYHYLWPVFEDDMGDYQGSPSRSPYDYWIAWRGITEPYGTGVAGGGEDIMQRFWELVSKDQATGLEALNRALDPRGTSLAAAYHAYAIAAKFLKPCGGGYEAPHCLEEGPAYAAAAGPTVAHASVDMGGTVSRSLPDNYALNWIALPTGVRLQAVLRNTGQGGRFRASVACDTGTGISVFPFSAVADARETIFMRSLDPAACPNPIGVVTNVAQTGADPQTSAARAYTLSVTPPPDPSRLSVTARAAGRRVIARGRLRPAGSGSKVRLTLFEMAGGWEKVRTGSAKVAGGGAFRKAFPRPDGSRCRVEARLAGDIERLPSTVRRTFPC